MTFSIIDEKAGVQQAAAIPKARICNLDDESKIVDSWAKLKSVRLMFGLFMDHKDEFE